MSFSISKILTKAEENVKLFLARMLDDCIDGSIRLVISILCRIFSIFYGGGLVILSRITDFVTSSSTSSSISPILSPTCPLHSYTQYSPPKSYS